MAELEIPGFEMLELLNRGSTAISVRAKQTSLNREVIIKVLQSDDSEEDEAAITGIIEANRQLGTLRHRGIVQVIDIDENDGMRYIVTEQPIGESITDLLAKRNTLPERQILRIIQRTAAALGEAWDKAGLVHGNLKPRCISIDEAGSVMISDLGMSRKGWIEDPDTGEYREIVLGTPNYMAPEQIEGRSRLDCKVDIYALGAIMYHAATGKMPFHDTPGEDAMARQLEDQIPNPRQLNPKVSNGLAYLIAAMMMKHPEDRYESWQDVLAEVKRIKGSKIFVQKAGALLRSTVQQLDEPTSVAERHREKDAPQSNTHPIFTLLKWAAVFALWAALANHLLALPPAV